MIILLLLLLLLLIIITATAVCPALSKEEHIKRDNNLCTQLHFNVYREVGVKVDKSKWCEHIPKPAETRQVTGLWNQKLQQTEPYHAKNQALYFGIFLLLDVSIPILTCVEKTEAEKKRLQY
jgi:hypothetical protein